MSRNDTIRSEGRSTRPRIVLAPHDLANADVYHRWFNDADLQFYNSDRRYAPSTLAETVDALKRGWLRPGPECERYAVHLASPGRRLIGQADIYEIHADNRRARIGLEIGEKDLWGRGLGREVLETLLESAFDRLRLARVEAVIYAFNERSIRLFESAGFVREGRLRERLDRDGVRHDEFVYGLLEREWRR